MYTTQPKKMLTINILNILKMYSDENQRLSQKDIAKLLQDEYQMSADRKTIKRTLSDLIDLGYQIEYSETLRKKSTGEEILQTDFYFVRDISDSELRYIIDSLLFSKQISSAQCRKLIDKLKKQSSKYFSAKVKHVCNLPENYPGNKQLFYTIDILDEAIEQKRQVEFSYSDFGIDKKLHPRLTDAGEIRRYRINPYQMVATNGRHYLICNNDAYDDISYYRIDRITDISILDSHAKPLSKVCGEKNGLYLPAHMAEHIYMFAGPVERVTFKAKKYIVSEIIDWFGTDVDFSNETDDEITASVRVNLSAMECWAMQYMPHVTVVAPDNLVSDIKRNLCIAKNHYLLK